MEKILNSIRMAPSAHNAQDYKFIMVKDREVKKDLAEACSSQRFIASAPIIFAGVSTNPDFMLSSDVPAFAMDIAIAFDHLSLAAVEENHFSEQL